MLSAASIVAYGGINKDNVDINTDLKEVAEIALGLFEPAIVIFIVDDRCDVAMAQAIDPAGVSLAHCELSICTGLKQRGSVLQGLMNGRVWCEDVTRGQIESEPATW